VLPRAATRLPRIAFREAAAYSRAVSDRDRIGRIGQWMDGGGWLEPSAPERDVATPLPSSRLGVSDARRTIAGAPRWAAFLLVAGGAIAFLPLPSRTLVLALAVGYLGFRMRPGAGARRTGPARRSLAGSLGG
jgi:hypothetical protein